jgi:RNA polymerase sigma factor for flagellar operon FliA
MDWVPRTLRQKNKEFEQLYNRLESELGREPTEAELAQKLSLTVEETREMIQKSAVVSLVSLDDYLEQNYEASFGVGSPEDTPEGHFDKIELNRMLTETIDKLSDKEKQVITLYYFEDLTLKEISSIMGVSESRISQIHTKAIFKLQTKLGKHRAILFS